jgi:hypothetical protein
MTAGRAIPVVRVPGGPVSLHDYLLTRVLEVVVHGDDVARSIPAMQVTEPPAAALTVRLDVCPELACSRAGSLGALRAFTRGERAQTDPRRVL